MRVLTERFLGTADLAAPDAGGDSSHLGRCLTSDTGQRCRKVESSLATDNAFDKDQPFSRQRYAFDPVIANGLSRTFKFGLARILS